MDLDILVPFLQKVSSEQELANNALSLKKSIESLPKEASAFIEDIEYKDLPIKVKTEVDRFVSCKPNTKLIHYGMVVKELLDRVDSKNYETAKEHLKEKEINKDELFKKLKEKFVLIINEKVIDGHHTIASCEKVGITSSLNCLDLTPVRFQKKASNLWEVLKSRIK